VIASGIAHVNLSFALFTQEFESLASKRVISSPITVENLVVSFSKPTRVASGTGTEENRTFGSGGEPTRVEGSMNSNVKVRFKFQELRH
jgi:hypothetical protein